MENRNLILAIGLSVAILLAFQWLAPAPKKPLPPPQTEATAVKEQQLGAEPPGTSAPAEAKREDVLKSTPRVAIDMPRITGSINLKGGRLDDLVLSDYHETVDPKSPAIVLLSPSGAPHAYVSEQGWVATVPDTKLPTADTDWTADKPVLKAGEPVTLSWDNGDGLSFSRMISVDQDYMFTVKDTVTNHGTAAVTLRPYALMARTGPPPVSSTWVSYEGPIAAFNGVEEDVKYGAIQEGAPVQRDSSGGWLGFSDKYWLGAVAPTDQQEPVAAEFKHIGSGDAQRYQADFLGAGIAVAAGAAASTSTQIFAGPKEVKLLAKYRDELGLPHFDNAVDFGWFWFFTKPIFYVLDWVFSKTGNFGIAIMILTVMMRILFFPLQTRAVLSMNKMKVLQPQIAKLREQYGDDKVKLNQETMELYKKAGANPLAGCLPIVMQIPVFFSLYKVLYVTIEMRHAPFFGWIHDLSAPDPTSIWNLFGLIQWTPPHQLPALGLWPIIYCVSMFLQQRMNPAPPDPVQARMMQLMPLFLMFVLGNAPAGLVIYWTWSNVLLLLQQYIITRHVAVPKPVKA